MRLEEMYAAQATSIVYTVETLTEEIGQIVVERQALRAAGAGRDALEENRRRLAAAQSGLSRLLIDRSPAACRRGLAASSGRLTCRVNLRSEELM